MKVDIYQHPFYKVLKRFYDADLKIAVKSKDGKSISEWQPTPSEGWHYVFEDDRAAAGFYEVRNPLHKLLLRQSFHPLLPTSDSLHENQTLLLSESLSEGLRIRGLYRQDYALSSEYRDLVRNNKKAFASMVEKACKRFNPNCPSLINESGEVNAAAFQQSVTYFVYDVLSLFQASLYLETTFMKEAPALHGHINYSVESSSEERRKPKFSSLVRLYQSMQEQEKAPISIEQFFKNPKVAELVERGEFEEWDQPLSDIEHIDRF